MWTLAFGYHEDRTPTHGYEPMREAANGGVRQELTAGVVQWKPRRIALLENGKTALERQDCTLMAWYLFLTIGRRELLAALGGAAAWPLTAHNDDRAAIVAALADNQGRQLRVPLGRYRVSAPILLPNGIHIRGDAHDGSSFQGGGSAFVAAFSNDFIFKCGGGSADDGRYIKLENLGFYGWGRLFLSEDRSPTRYRLFVCRTSVPHRPGMLDQ
jgi:hypothetical protein